MDNARFILSKEILSKQVKILEDLGLKISYSYKTNRVVGNVLQDLCPDVEFSIHAKEELNDIKDKSKIWFFIQAESIDELKNILKLGVKKFVVDNKVDFERILKAVNGTEHKIFLSLRMKFQEHRIGTGRYFVYGFSAEEINQLINNAKSKNIASIGVHIHRKSQNITEWNIKEELVDSLSKESLKRIDFVNFGGGLPSIYRSNYQDLSPYLFKKLKEAKAFLDEFEIESYIEPGRFICAPAVKLVTEIIQVYDSNLIINTSIYNCALDTILAGTKMIVEGEMEDSGEGDYYLIKGNSPTRDDIFRYKVRLKNPKVGDSLVFLNAGAYNYSTDFFGYNPLETEITR